MRLEAAPRLPPSNSLLADLHNSNNDNNDNDNNNHHLKVFHMIVSARYLQTCRPV